MIVHMTLEQAELLATLCSSLRPDWGVNGIVAALEPLATTVDATLLTLALLHAANDPTNQTPAIIKHPGPHWDKARATTPPLPKAEARKPLRQLDNDTSPMCPQHPTVREWACKTCNIPAPPPANFREMIEAAAEKSRAERQALLTQIAPALDAANERMNPE
jgi:hypothetical protein